MKPSELNHSKLHRLVQEYHEAQINYVDLEYKLGVITDNLKKAVNRLADAKDLLDDYVEFGDTKKGGEVNGEETSN